MMLMQDNIESMGARSVLPLPGYLRPMVVPDGEETTNTWVSWILVIFGVIGIMISLIWKTRNPLELDDKK